MSRTFRLCKSTNSKYYRRHRALPTFSDGKQGEVMNCLITRFGYQQSKYHRAHDVYLGPDGNLYGIHNEAVAFNPDGTPSEWAHCFELVPDSMYSKIQDRYPHIASKENDLIYS